VRFKVDLHERTVGKLLHKLKMIRLQPRPFHPKSDPKAQEAYKKLCTPGSRHLAARSGREDHRGLVPG